MRRLVLLAMVPLVLTMACARPVAGAGGPAPAASRDAGIYTAVLRRYLTTPGENANLPFTEVFVLDHAEPGVADPMHKADPTKVAAIPAADQRIITAALRDVTPVSFTASRDDVVRGKDRCATVRDGGILIVLGPPTPAGGSAFHVGINGFAACLGATWHTYVVSGTHDKWVVTGIVGPVSVS